MINLGVNPHVIDHNGLSELEYRNLSNMSNLPTSKWVVTLFTDPFLHFCKKGHLSLALFTFSVKWDTKSLFTDEIPFLRIFAYFYDF